MIFPVPPWNRELSAKRKTRFETRPAEPAPLRRQVRTCHYPLDFTLYGTAGLVASPSSAHPGKTKGRF